MAVANAQKGRLRGKLASEINARESIEGATGLAERLLDQLRALDFRCFESIETETAVEHLTRGPMVSLVRLLGESARLIRSLPPLVGAGHHTVNADEQSPEAPEPAVAVAAVEGLADPPLDKFSEELDAVLKLGLSKQLSETDVQSFIDVCNRTVQAMRASVDLLRQASREQSKWGLITAGEEGRRKAQKGLRATAIMAMRLVKPGAAQALFPNDGSELQTALEVRASLMAFRRDIHGLVQPMAGLGDMDIGLLMRDVRVRLSQLFGDEAYHDVRAPDRFELQQMHAAITTWVDKAWTDFETARALLVTVQNFAQGLGRVNRRQILVEHDQEIKVQVLAKLQTLTREPPANNQDGWRGLSNALRDAKKMAWRDDGLDTLVQAELVQGASGPDVQSRAGLLFAALTAVAMQEAAPPAP